MNIEMSAFYSWVIIFIMAGITLLTRWGGVFIMSYVSISDRVQRFIQAMSSSVLIALLAPIAIEGDHGARLALLTTAILIVLMKKPLIAISGGILIAALSRQFI